MVVVLLIDCLELLTLFHVLKLLMLFILLNSSLGDCEITWFVFLHCVRGMSSSSVIFCVLYRSYLILFQFSLYFTPDSVQIEVVSRSLGSLFWCLVGEKSSNWDLVLPTIDFAYNNFVNKSIGKSPFEILHGRLIYCHCMCILNLPSLLKYLHNTFMICMMIFDKKLRRVMNIIIWLLICIV